MASRMYHDILCYSLGCLVLPWLCDQAVTEDKECIQADCLPCIIYRHVCLTALYEMWYLLQSTLFIFLIAKAIYNDDFWIHSYFQTKERKRMRDKEREK